MTALTDQGIHLTPEDVQEQELKAAGWKPVAAHPHSPIWVSPEGLLTPGPGYAWSLLSDKRRKAKEDKEKADKEEGRTICEAINNTIRMGNTHDL